jgi:nucleoside-diphosphate-sugar epimerase
VKCRGRMERFFSTPLFISEACSSENEADLMLVFVTGASGFIGSAVVAELLAFGHQVLGLARSDDADRALQAAGAEVQRGSLEDGESLRAGAVKCDGVIHLAFKPEYSRFEESCAVDQRAIETIGKSLTGTGKPFIVPNGMAGIASGRIVTEEDSIPQNYRFPRVSEQTALHLASQGVVASVIRLPQVHNTTKQGLITGLIEMARDKGVSACIGEGANRWPAAHVSDVARLFRLALEAPEAGAKYHAVAEEGIEMRLIAGAISHSLAVPMKSLTAEEARDHFGPLSMFIGEDMPASSRATREKMRWHPAGPTLIADLEKIGQPGFN